MAVVLVEKSDVQDEVLSSETPNKGVEVVVHINESLEENQRDELKEYLQSQRGIRDVEFCSNRFHLMLVTYDSEVVSSQVVLERVRNHNMHAQLVGPI